VEFEHVADARIRDLVVEVPPQGPRIGGRLRSAGACPLRTRLHAAAAPDDREADDERREPGTRPAVPAPYGGDDTGGAGARTSGRWTHDSANAVALARMTITVERIEAEAQRRG
jgi:hypothetical protein